MKTLHFRPLLSGLCGLFATAACAAGEAADAIQPNSVWEDHAKRSLIILERQGETYRARFTSQSGFIREVTGQVKGDKIFWLAKDVHAISGGPGGDNFGTIKGDRIDFTYSGKSDTGREVSGAFTLTRLPGTARSTPAPLPAVPYDPQQPLIEAFSQLAPNASAWVLAPLDESVPPNVRQNLIFLREDLLDEDKQKPKASAEAYQLASQLCSVMINALDERTQTLVHAGYRAAQADTTTGISGDQALSARRNYMMNWPQYRREQAQRNELKSEAIANAQLLKERPKVEWSDRTTVLRKTIDGIYARFREALRERPPAK